MSTEVDQEGLERRLLNNLTRPSPRPSHPPGRRVLGGTERPRRAAPRSSCPAASATGRQPHPTPGGQPAGRPQGRRPRTAADLRPRRSPARHPGREEGLRVAQKRLMLIKGRPDLQEAALAMLNEQLPVAVTNAANIGSGRLQSALLEIRREFARQGKEIILLIEDFALIQGIQRDLLDAIIEVGERDGRVVMAPVRTLMAVTTGYYSRLADTVLTRAKAATPYVYDLDVQFDASEKGIAETVAFVGRYLNAARIGRENSTRKASARPRTSRISAKTATTVRSAIRLSGTPPRATASTRSTRRPCGARSARAPARKIRMRSIRGPSSAKWCGTSWSSTASPSRTARSRTLTSGRSTPPRPLSRPCPRPSNSHWRTWIRWECGRRTTFLEFWGDSPPEPVNLSPVLHHAFDISLLELESYKPPPRPRGKPGSEKPEKPEKPGGLSEPRYSA